MGRYLEGPFPLGSVLCTYEQPLAIQYNTIQYRVYAHTYKRSAHSFIQSKQYPTPGDSKLAVHYNFAPKYLRNLLNDFYGNFFQISIKYT